MGERQPAVEDLVAGPACRFCGAPLEHVFADLGSSPLANSFLRAEDLARPSRSTRCPSTSAASACSSSSRSPRRPEEIFSDYVYFSSFSDSWVEHAAGLRRAIVERLGLGRREPVVELASNDGYLLQWFVERGVPVLGVEPAANVAAAAVERGIPTHVAFFGSETARDLLGRRRSPPTSCSATTSSPTCPDLNDFVAGVAILLKPDGRRDLRVPAPAAADRAHRVRHDLPRALLVLLAARRRAGLRAARPRLFDVEELPTHGGSLRIYVQHARAAGRAGRGAARAGARGRARPARALRAPSSSRCARRSATCSSS